MKHGATLKKIHEIGERIEMGITYSAKIIVGRPYEDIDFQGLIGEDQDPLDFVWDNDFDQASPYYDSPQEECLIGVTLLSSVS